MSRKSAYALKARDSAFAAAWDEVVKVRRAPRKGDKTREAHEPPIPSSQGYKPARAALPNWTSIRRQHDEALRDLFFARLAATRKVAPEAMPQ